MKKYIISLTAIFSFIQGYSRGVVRDSVPNLPVVILPAKADSNTPLVLFISGDGGWKDFSPKLANQFVQEKVPVVALNALHYFWDRKTPEQTTKIVQYLLDKYMKQWHKQSFILVGYSFGADVMPFIINRLPDNLMESCKGVALFSPGTSTDFEIHLSQMLNNHRKWKYDVVKEMGVMKPVRVLGFFGDEEHDFPVRVFSKPDWQVIYLKGGHHYEEAEDNLAGMVLQRLTIEIK